MEKQSLRILALGDSYTIGTGVEFKDRWPMQLANALRAQGMAVNEPTILAKNGWQTRDLLDAIQNTGFSSRFDWVTLLIGVNNQYDGGSLEEYRIEFRELLRLAVNFVNGSPAQVLVLSIPDWGITPFAASRNRSKISTEIDQFNIANREEANKVNARYLDITTLSRTFGDDPDFLASDGLHPSQKMYSVWVELILPVIANAVPI